MRVLIVDDEPLSITRMMVCLQNFPDVTVIGTCKDGQQALKAIRKDKPDLVFLDVHLPAMNAFELLEELEDENRPLVIFVTAYEKFAVQAIEAQAVAYLLKPLKEERLARALERARSRLESQERAFQAGELWELVQDLREGAGPDVSERISKILQGYGRARDFIWVRDRGKISRVDVECIEWIRAVRDYVCIFVPNRKTYLLRETMRGLEERLDPAKFLRVHRSAIVNQSMVRELRFTNNGGHLLIMNSGEEVRVGRTYSPVISRRFARKVMASG